MKRYLKVFIVVVIILSMIPLMVMAESAEYAFDEYGMKENTNSMKIFQANNNWIEFEEKWGVLLEKEWTITFSGEVTHDKIDGMVIERDSEFIPVRIKLSGQNKATVTPVGTYDPSSRYCLKIFLNNGNRYMMYFNTERQDTINYQYLSLDIVKNGYFYNYPEPIVSEAFERFFDYPKWEYFYSTENNHIVEFTGNAKKDGLYGNFRIQFTVDIENGSFVDNYYEFNNLQLPKSESIKLLDAIYKVAPSGPVTVNQIPYKINILRPDGIGTVYMEATYKNNTRYPITSYQMTVLLKDTNKKTYLSNYDTIMPGSTSPIFDTFGPKTMRHEDYEILTISIRAELPNNRYLRMEYDTRLNKYKYNEYNN